KKNHFLIFALSNFSFKIGILRQNQFHHYLFRLKFKLFFHNYFTYWKIIQNVKINQIIQKTKNYQFYIKMKKESVQFTFFPFDQINCQNQLLFWFFFQIFYLLSYKQKKNAFYYYLQIGSFFLFFISTLQISVFKILLFSVFNYFSQLLQSLQDFKTNYFLFMHQTDFFY
ncbi:hypothetical protein IMG5_144550, partial [Ichthyophthirius multifiliis]